MESTGNDNYIQCPKCNFWYLSTMPHVCGLTYDNTFSYSFDSEQVKLLKEILESLKRIENILESW